MGSIYWPFFMRKLLYRDLIVLFGYSLKVEKLKNCVCICMFGFCKKFYELSLGHLEALLLTDNYAWCWTLSNLKYLKEKLHLVQLKTCSTKWNRCGALRLQYVKIILLSSLLNWTSGSYKNSEQSVQVASQIFSSYSNTRFMDRPICKLTRWCWHLRHIWTVNLMVSPSVSQRMALRPHVWVGWDTY